VGLDSDLARLPDQVRHSSDPQLHFNTEIVEATADIAAAFKPNSAFYEANGAVGITALINTVAMIRRVAPDALVILDAKRGDIGSTNSRYADFAFRLVGADALTVHPYLGSEAAKELTEVSGAGIFVLCRTSNPGAGEIQDLQVRLGHRHVPLHTAVAAVVRDRWNRNTNCGLVIGATYAEELSEIRREAPDLPVLVPGVGAQGGDLKATVGALLIGRAPALINSSRGIIFASNGADFADAAHDAAAELDTAIRHHRRSFAPT
jgi:orotidine-5'-phosphate decarboxylase